VKFVIFGLTISSSWGNGHATLWRGLCRALHTRGHEVTFFEKDVPYYAAHRDALEPAGCDLHLYRDWDDVRDQIRRALDRADVGIVTSYCPDSNAACDEVLDSQSLVRVFYDLDTGVTLARLMRGEPVAYIPARGLGDFDLVLSYSGGRALDEVRSRLGARRVVPLYGSVDPHAHRRVEASTDLRADLSYLGTYASDRQQLLEELFIEPARRRPSRRFVIGGSQYPPEFPWTSNMFYVWHMPPAYHSTFYSSSTMTLNVTRGSMANTGWCPSGRLFEAAACGTPILTDTWDGLDHFFEPSREVLVARTTDEVLAAMDLPPDELRHLGQAARERTLAEHTAECRVRELERALVSS
jgi:spore maturation protein CgeB